MKMTELSGEELDETTQKQQVEAKAEESTETETKETDAGETAVAAESTEAVEEKPRKLGGFQKKLAKKDAEIEFLRGELAKNAKPAETVVQAGKPKPEDFNSNEDYLDKLTDWKLDQKEKAIAAKNEEKSKQTESQKKTESYNSRLNDFKKEAKDFEDVIETFIDEHGDIDFSGPMNELILDSENGPAVIYELAKNKDELDRLNSLSPLAAAKAFALLEAKLAKPKEQKTTKAPAPVKPVGSKPTPIKKDLYDEDLSPAEFRKMKQELFRAKRA